MTSCYSAWRPLVESEATLFSGSSPILVVALKWLSVETLELLWSWSNMEFCRVQSWVLFFTCYIPPTFQPYSPNTPHLVTFMLMMYRRSSMAHLLISSLLLAALMLSLKICTSGCLPTGYRSIQTRHNLSDSALPSNFRSLPSPCSQKDFPPLLFPPVFETLA